VALWRYPVKSMMGEELNTSFASARGLLGDRAYALLDKETGKIASAKNPKKWPNLFEFRAAYVEPPAEDRKLPPVWITLPDGTLVRSDEEKANRILSQAVGREVTLTASAPAAPGLEEYWPEVEGLAHQDTVTDEAMAPELFFDAAPLHVLTTATLDRLRAAYPQGRFETRRFRPNVVVAVDSAAAEFVENAWVGSAVGLGDQVLIEVGSMCPRCVMTTLAQGDLPRDLGILRAAAQHNSANVGIYAKVVREGRIVRGDTVRLGVAAAAA
jgi:hypothetical protein